MKIGVVLFLLFTLIPALETWLIIEVGSRVGAVQTTLSLVLAGLLGAWLGKRAGGTVIREIFAGLRRGEPPADKIIEGVLALIGAVLLITPGYLTDVVGLLLLFQPARRWLAPRVKGRLWVWLSARGFKIGGDGGPGPAARGPAARGPAAAESHFDHPVAE